MPAHSPRSGQRNNFDIEGDAALLESPTCRRTRMQATRALNVMLIATALLFTAACGQQSNCSGVGFGSTGGSGSGSTGSVNTGGSVCGSGNNGGGGGGNGSISDFLYYLSFDTTVQNPTTDSVQGASLTTSGTFGPITNFTAPSFALDATQNMVVVNKQFLYIPQPNLNKIQAFSINRTTGGLTAIPGSPFATAGGSSVVSDPQGHFLFVGSSTTGQISVFQINATTGALTQNSNSPFATSLLFSFFVKVDGQGKYLYVSQHDPSLPTGVFSIDPTTGDLLAVGTFALGISGGEIASPAGASSEYFISGSGIGGDNNLYIFAIDPTSGIPTAVNGSPFATTATPNFVAVHPSGKFIYASEVGTTIGPLEGFQIDSASGALTAISPSAFTNLSDMQECQFDQSGANAFCLSSTGYNVLSVNSSTGVPTSSIPELSVGQFVFAVTN
jgi:6-phosphogluconolactonase (cycloisomerase 2 family)